MSSTYPRFTDGPVTYQVSAAVAAGQVVQADGAKVEPADANSATAIGVVLVSGAASQPTSGDPLVVHIDSDYVAVAQHGTVKVTFSEATAFGVRVGVTAGGTVGAASTGPDIGFCAEPGGVAEDGVGLLRLSL